MKNNRRSSILLLSATVFVSLVFFSNCKKMNDISEPPHLTTSPVSEISENSIKCGGNISSDGGSDVTARGVCWSTSPNPTVSDNKTSDGSGTGTFSSEITGLEAFTNYYIRAYATNNNGTSYGNTYSFKTLQGTVKDIDGNIYYSTRIGTQIWMAENLKTTRYNDSNEIPYLYGSTWNESTTGAYGWYNNNYINNDIYGALYNWYTVKTGKLCPDGWHVPTDEDWNILANYLGGEEIAGGKLKEEGTIHWNSPNTLATNEYGFNALPGGFRTDLWGNPDSRINVEGFWWTSSFDTIINRIICKSIRYDSEKLYSYTDVGARWGFSIRCIKD